VVHKDVAVTIEEKAKRDRGMDLDPQKAILLNMAEYMGKYPEEKGKE
jgi:hypothetical protein